MEETSTDPMFEGISTVVGNRHAFVHERVLELIVRETLTCGSVRFAKKSAASKLGCSVKSLDRAIRRLRTHDLIETVPTFLPNGAQSSNDYRATREGIEFAKRLQIKARAAVRRGDS